MEIQPKCNLKQHQKLLEDVDNGVESTPTAVNEIWPRCVDVVMSDMAPNASGQYEHDVLNICQLARGAYDLASVFLKVITIIIVSGIFLTTVRNISI